MFSRRRDLDGSRRYGREFFEALVNDLSRAGFKDIRIRLPHNLVGLDNSLIAPDELLRRERNYPASILIATHPENTETLKVLFVNTSAKTVFADDTFPGGQSERPTLYFQSPDPGRTYSVFEFFYEYLSRLAVREFRIESLANTLAFLLALAEGITILSTGNGILGQRFHQPVYLDVVVMLASQVVAARFFALPKGLWIKPQRELRLTRLVVMAIRGELRDNPVVSVLVQVIGIILAALILRLFGFPR